MFSIVATETSVLTFISVPGIAYRGDWTFLQLAIGYIFGRCLVSYFLLPIFFKNGITSIYEILADHFNVYIQKLASVTFLITRVLADGVRFLATAIIIQSITGWSISESILLIGIVTLVYTVFGGLKAIIHIDAFQFGIYLFSALICIYFLLDYSDRNLISVISSLNASNKITMFSFTSDFLSNPFSFLSAFIGGTMLSFASHGSDYMMVQRVLATKDLTSAKKAMIGSGVFVFLQFFLFLFIGSLIYLVSDCIMIDKDREITYVIKNILPVGFKGIVIAGVLSAAMSTLSSSINSLSSSTLRDWLPKVDSLLFSRLIALAWTAVLIVVAYLFNQGNNSLLIVGLKIASFTYGVLLSFFILSKIGSFRTESVLYGFAVGVLSVFICMQFNIAWTYYIFLSVLFNISTCLIIEKNKKNNLVRDVFSIVVLFLMIQILFTDKGDNEKTVLIDVDVKKSCYHEQVWLGSDVLLKKQSDILNVKNVGLLINNTSGIVNINEELKLVSSKLNYVNTKVIFTPEHGLVNNYEAGQSFSDDHSFNIPIVSLYGNNLKPDYSYLKNLDAIIFDIQDIGSRYYTYVSTMTYMMEACADLGIKFYVLDRPNPISGFVNGPILDDKYSSFVGLHEIKIRHGMTVGELAYMINEEGWINNKVDLHIVKMKGWNRKMYFDETGLAFKPPSPNIPDLETALLYSGLCLIEGTNLSEGRGTAFPFKQIGAPWLDVDKVIEDLERNEFQGIEFQKTYFTPESIPGKSINPKYEGEVCSGLKIKLTDRTKARPLDFAMHFLQSVKKTHKGQFNFLSSNFIDKLYGSDKLRLSIENNQDVSLLIESWNNMKNKDGYFIY